MHMTDLSADQREAASAIMSWLQKDTRTKQTLTFAGYAGTGKTTVVSVLARELPQPLAFCAFTGKASSVLARKLKEHGIDTTPKTRVRDEDGERIEEWRPYCGTIHGLIHWPCRHCSPPDNKDDKSPKKWIADCPICENSRFTQRVELDRPYKLIVCDEASMVSDKMLAKMLSYNVPILAVGDHGQLKPVITRSDDDSGSLMLSPDVRLEKIHRQAEGNPIIALSQCIRETGDVHERFADGKHVHFAPSNKLLPFLARSYTPGRDDILSMAVICWTNKTRVWINRSVRDYLGRGRSTPIKSDIVVCLKNKPPIYNGMRGVITTDVEGDGNEKRPKFFAEVDFPEDGVGDKNAMMSALQFNEERTITRERAYEMGVMPLASLGDLYDYGYALTCHKMQGSQAAKIAVVIVPGQRHVMNKRGSDEYTRWLYTAVTRSSDRLVIFR